LFLTLFRGRENVCAKRWKSKPGYSPFCFNDFKTGICNKPRIKCTECKNSRFATLNSEQLKKHLMGEEVLGLYPMTEKDTCYLLVIDLDEARWQDDSNVIRNVCVENKIPVYVERSRSGQGCHIWFFFDAEIKASIARNFGMTILNLAMQKCGEIKFDSYDRLFPSQDFLQKDGFGNLIALPLQKEARVKNNSVFVDENFNVFKDQFNLLSECDINYSIIDSRMNGKKIDVSFKGELKEKQQLAFEEMNKFENGVLSATTGFGKTVMELELLLRKRHQH